jgi:hypothetical protein
MADVNALIAQGGNFAPPDVGALFSEAYKLKEMQQAQGAHNALKAMFSDPNNLDPVTKEPTVNALAVMAKDYPEQAMAVTGQVAKMDHDRAVTNEDTQKANLSLDNLINQDIRIPASKIYEDTLKANGGDKVAAQKAAQEAYTESVDTLLKSGSVPRGMADQFAPDFDYERVRSRILLNKVHNTDPSQIAGAWKTGTTDDGTPSEFNLVTDEVRPTPKGFRPDSELSLAEHTRHDHAEEDAANKRLAAAVAGGVGDLDPTTLDFFAEQIANGQPMPALGMGVAAAKLRKQLLNRAASIGTEEAGGDPRAGGAGAVVQRGEYKADVTELSQLRRMQGNVKSFIGTPAHGGQPGTGAEGEADLVISLLDKGTSKFGGTWANHVAQNFRTGATSDPDVVSLRNALLSLQQESAKVMQGSTGSVAAVSDSMSREIDKALSGDMSIPAIMKAIETMRVGWRNRPAGIADEIAGVEAQLRQHTRGGGGSPASATGGLATSGHVATPTNKTEFDALPSGAHYRKPGDPPDRYRTKP